MQAGAMTPSPRARTLGILTSLCFLLSACSAGRVGGADQTLSRQINEILHRRDTRGDARFVARVVELRSGRELYAANIDSPFIPASNGKLAVTAATLARLGSKHTFKTYLAMDGDDLWLIGT